MQHNELERALPPVRPTRNGQTHEIACVNTPPSRETSRATVAPTDAVRPGKGVPTAHFGVRAESRAESKAESGAESAEAPTGKGMPPAHIGSRAESGAKWRAESRAESEMRPKVKRIALLSGSRDALPGLARRSGLLFGKAPRASSLAGPTIQLHHRADAPDPHTHEETEAWSDGEFPTTASAAGSGPALRPEAANLLAEGYEMDGEASPGDVEVAETALARLLVRLWRARQPGQHADVKGGTDFGGN